MEIALILIGFILCALAAFAGAFFGVRTLDMPLQIPIYSDIKEAAERKRERADEKEGERVLNEYFFGEEG